LKLFRYALVIIVRWSPVVPGGAQFCDERKSHSDKKYRKVFS